MAGTKIGGERAAVTNKAKHGQDFFARIGRIGGKNGTTGGFAYTELLCDCDIIEPLHKKAQCAGKKGGKASKRRPVSKGLTA